MITIQDIGRRLKEVRRYFKLTQANVANEIGVPQNMVSRLECGRDVSSEKLISFLAFYSKYVNIDAIFDDRFDIFSGNVKFTKKLHLDSIVVEKIKILDEERKNFNRQMDEQVLNLIDIAEKQANT